MGLLDWFRRKDEREVFAERMIAALRRTGETRKIAFVKESFELHIGGADNRFFLGNAWGEYRAAPRAERDRVFHAFAAAIADPGVPDTWERAEGHVLPRVRERAYYELLRLRMRLEGKDPGDLAFLARPLTEHLAEGIVFDSANSIREVGGEQIEKWGVTLADVDLRGLENLRAMSEGAFVSPRPGLWVSAREDTHDATRLLLEDEIRALRVEGDPVAFVPHRNVLLITGSSDTGCLRAIGELLAKNLDMPRLMTFVPAKLGADGWETWSCPLPEVQHLELLSRAREYEEQRELLQALEGDATFVGKLIVMEKDGAERCFTSWTETVPTLLPRAQWVCFTRPEKGVLGFARFEKALELLPGLMAPAPDLYPPRWRVEGFPSAKQLEQVLEPLA